MEAREIYLCSLIFSYQHREYTMQKFNKTSEQQSSTRNLKRKLACEERRKYARKVDKVRYQKYLKYNSNK